MPMQHQWPHEFTEVRSLIPDGDDMLACIGCANPPYRAEVWRHAGTWSREAAWDGQARVLDAVRFNGSLFVALGGKGAQIARDGQIVCDWPGWGLLKRLLQFRGELYALLMGRRRATDSGVWRTSDGENWIEVQSPIERGAYQATVLGDRIVVGTLGPPVDLITFGTGGWREIVRFDAAEIESFTHDGDSLYFTVGTRPAQKSVPPVWRFDGERAEALPGMPLVWRIANNFNASVIHDGALHVSSAGRYVWPSVWRREGSGWTRIARFPKRRGQWIYDMTSHKGSLYCAFAGKEGAAEILRIN